MGRRAAGPGRFARFVLPVLAVAWLGGASAAGVDLQWMMSVQAGIPAGIHVDQIFEDHGQIVVVGAAPHYFQISNYLRKIRSDGLGVPHLMRVTASGKVQAFTIRISRLAGAGNSSVQDAP